MVYFASSSGVLRARACTRTRTRGLSTNFGEPFTGRGAARNMEGMSYPRLPTLAAVAAHVLHTSEIPRLNLQQGVKDGTYVRIVRGYYLRAKLLDTFTRGWQTTHAVRLARIIAISRRRGDDQVAVGLAAAWIHGVGYAGSNPCIMFAPHHGSRGLSGTLEPVVRGVQELVGTMDLRRVRRAIPRGWIGTFLGIRALTIEGTIAWLATTLPAREAIVAGSLLLRKLVGFDRERPRESDAKAETAKEAITRVLAEETLWPGRMSAAAVIRRLNPAVESVAEGRLLVILQDAELMPRARMQYLICSDRPKVFADFAFIAERLVLEFDGMEKLREAGGTLDPAAVKRLMQRDDRMVQNDWRVMHIYWADLDNPPKLLERIRKALASARSGTAI